MGLSRALRLGRSLALPWTPVTCELVKKEAHLSVGKLHYSAPYRRRVYVEEMLQKTCQSG